MKGKYDRPSNCWTRLSRYRPFICTLIGTSFIAAIISIEVILSIHYVVPNDSNNFDDYSPNDTRLIPYSYRLCQGLTLTSGYSDTHPSVSLYLLKAAPVLNGSESFSFVQSVYLDEMTNNVSWAINMYTGSNVSVSACGDAPYPVVLYLIKGSVNYSKWNDNPSEKYALQNDSTSDSKQCLNLTYTVSLSDEYFLVFYQSNTSIKSSLNATFEFYRTKYTYSKSSIAALCSINLNRLSCSMGVPMSSGSSALLVVNDTESFSWGDTVTIGVNCNPRVWVYVMVTLTIALLLIVLLSGLIVLCVYVRARMYGRRSSYTRIN